MFLVTFLLVIPTLIALSRIREHEVDIARCHGEMPREGVLGLGHRDRPAPQPLEGGHAAVGDAAGHDERVRREVVGDVQREAVGSDPPRDADADGADLVAPDPAAGEAGHPLRLHAEVAAGPDHHFE